MGRAEQELRKMCESTLSRVRDDVKNKRVANVETTEKIAIYALSEIEKNFQGTGHPGEPPKPWAGMSVMEMQKQVALWCLEAKLT